jgi:hypothetical protein
MRCDEEPGSATCAPVQSQRIRYFTGRHMTARDFRDGDEYHRTHRLLHNRVLHGTGVVCGLDVRVHWNPDCVSDRVIVRCGLAIDCCGREIVVPKDVVTRPMPWTEGPKTGDEKHPAPDPRYVLILCLSYCERPIEKVPVLYNENACASPEMEDGRIQEGYALCWKWVKREDLTTYGWRGAEGCAPTQPGKPDPEKGEHQDGSRHEDGHKHEQEQYPDKPEPAPTHPHPDEPDPCGDDGRCCLDPVCPPCHCVLLAVIVPVERGDMNDQNDIDTSGRPTVDAGRDRLTNICWINWKHGGVMPVRDLKRLEIRFSRPLKRPPETKRCGPNGVNACTFQVQYGAGEDFEDLDFVAYDRPPYLSADGRTAIYELDHRRGFRNLIGLTVFVTLKCDFLVDCEDKAVDGNHLCGRLPTGDGVAGGTFESWFRVVHDRDHDDYPSDTHQSKGGAS